MAAGKKVGNKFEQKKVMSPVEKSYKAVRLQVRTPEWNGSMTLLGGFKDKMMPGRPVDEWPPAPLVPPRALKLNKAK